WFSYDHDAPALEGASFAVAPGSFAALIGPNGAGKSTLLRLLLGLLRPARGTLEIFGAPPGGRAAPIGYVPQRVKLPAGFPLTVAEVALMGRYGRLGLLRRPAAADRALALHALEQVGLADQARRRFSDLSGGQQQRALIARALAGEPNLLLLDEPTAGLDPAARARFYALVCDLQHGQGLTVLCASHDLEIVSEHVDRLILLDRAVRADGSPGDVLASAALTRAYAFPVGHEHA
ncbi:MAG TPA: metal ABC transporter ATP-binding protein, partial [Planctomycetota bacterium]|nr:metal ABC transporter ATP-binding protein [Planctomycetota bacterium]